MSEEGENFRLIKDTRTKGELSEAKPRSKKLNPRIDLAAMVSVSFLLIIFFMVTKELARPQAMNLGIPDCGPDYSSVYGCRLMDHRRQITLLLDDNNQVVFYRGLLDLPDENPKRLDYGKEGIRKELSRVSRQIRQLTGHKDQGAIILIKPSKKSNYGNLVDILDEMAITDISSYAIVNDYTSEEMKLLASK